MGKEITEEKTEIEKYKELIHKKVDETENINILIKVITILRFLK